MNKFIVKAHILGKEITFTVKEKNGRAFFEDISKWERMYVEGDIHMTANMGSGIVVGGTYHVEEDGSYFNVYCTLLENPKYEVVKIIGEMPKLPNEPGNIY